MCSVSMGTQTDPHWVLVPASSLDHLETQIKTVKENLIRKQHELIKVRIPDKTIGYNEKFLNLGDHTTTMSHKRSDQSTG